jgi:hypothetical protein
MDFEATVFRTASIGDARFRGAKPLGKKQGPIDPLRGQIGRDLTRKRSTPLSPLAAK